MMTRVPMLQTERGKPFCKFLTAAAPKTTHCCIPTLHVIEVFLLNSRKLDSLSRPWKNLELSYFLRLQLLCMQLHNAEQTSDAGKARQHTGSATWFTLCSIYAVQQF